MSSKCWFYGGSYHTGSSVTVYFADCGERGIKIGATCRPHARAKQLKNVPRFLFGFFIPNQIVGYNVELAFHEHFKGKRLIPKNVDYYELSASELEEAKDLGMVCFIDGEGYWSASCLCHPRRSMIGRKTELLPVVRGLVRPSSSVLQESPVMLKDGHPESKVASDWEEYWRSRQP